MYGKQVCNYSGTKFDFRIDRNVELLSDEAIRDSLNLDTQPPAAVAYRTTNRLTNLGIENWAKETGLLSIWLLGMYKHGPKTTVVIPFKAGAEAKLGPVVNDDYFGKVPASRLRVADGVLFFSAEGQ